MCPLLLLLLCLVVRESAASQPKPAPSEQLKHAGLNGTAICQQTCLRDANRNFTADGTSIPVCLNKCLRGGVRVPTRPQKFHPAKNRTRTDWCKVSDSAGWQKNTDGYVIPGVAQDVGVTFFEKAGVWHAKITWKLPKGVKVTDRWKGYVVLWSSYGRFLVSCRQILDKRRTEFVIKSGDDWEYPNEVYVAVVGVPSIVKENLLLEFSPVTDTVGRVPPPTAETVEKRQPNTCMILGVALVGLGLLCVAAALLIRFRRRHKDTLESKCETELPFPGPAHKRSSWIWLTDNAQPLGGRTLRGLVREPTVPAGGNSLLRAPYC